MFDLEKSPALTTATFGPFRYLRAKNPDGISHYAIWIVNHLKDWPSIRLNNRWLILKWNSIKWHWGRAKVAVIPWPIYYINDGRDCDHVRVIAAHKARNGLEFLRGCDSIYEHAEGPEYIWRVSKAEYEVHETSRRDYLMEAYEDGHPYSVEY